MEYMYCHLLKLVHIVCPYSILDPVSPGPWTDPCTEPCTEPWPDPCTEPCTEAAWAEPRGVATLLPGPRRLGELCGSGLRLGTGAELSLADTLPMGLMAFTGGTVAFQYACK